MRVAFVLCVCVGLSNASSAEDPQLRARAFELVERARDISTVKTQAPVLNETVLMFRAVAPDGTMREGSYSRVYGGPGATREEFTSNNFHLIRITLPDRLSSIGPSRVLPPEFRDVLTLVPIQIWHLDQTDIVREIRRAERKGVAAQCVEFETVRGADHFNNEMCFDAATGSQIYDRSGNMELENSEFFDFAGSQQPAHVRQYRDGVLKVDVQLTRHILTDPPNSDVFIPPASADTRQRCQTVRRAFGVTMPQPPGNGGALTNVVVHGVIGTDGRIFNAAVQDSPRPDLNDEALQIVKTWSFTPPMCNGKPGTQEVDLVVHFQGR